MEQMTVGAQLKELVGFLAKIVQTTTNPGEDANNVSSTTTTHRRRRHLSGAKKTLQQQKQQQQQKSGGGGGGGRGPADDGQRCSDDGVRKLLLKEHASQYATNSKLLRTLHEGFSKMEQSAKRRGRGTIPQTQASCRTDQFKEVGVCSCFAFCVLRFARACAPCVRACERACGGVLFARQTYSATQHRVRRADASPTVHRISRAHTHTHAHARTHARTQLRPWTLT